MAKARRRVEIAKQSESEARSSRQMARSAHRLNVLAAFFFPLATISGVLGIDGDFPWKADVQLILALLAGGLVAGALLAWGSRGASLPPKYACDTNGTSDA